MGPCWSGEPLRAQAMQGEFVGINLERDGPQLGLKYIGRRVIGDPALAAQKMRG